MTRFFSAALTLAILAQIFGTAAQVHAADELKKPTVLLFVETQISKTLDNKIEDYAAHVETKMQAKTRIIRVPKSTNEHEIQLTIEKEYNAGYVRGAIFIGDIRIPLVLPELKIQQTDDLDLPKITKNKGFSFFPTAHAASPTPKIPTFFQNESGILDATKTFDPDGKWVAVRWDFDFQNNPDEVWDTDFNTDFTLNRTFKKLGLIAIRMQAKDIGNLLSPIITKYAWVLPIQNASGSASPDQNTQNESGSASTNQNAKISDIDNDGILDQDDNCPFTPNTDQTDKNQNDIGDACEFLIYFNSNQGDNITETEDCSFPNELIAGVCIPRTKFVPYQIADKTDADGNGMPDEWEKQYPDKTDAKKLQIFYRENKKLAQKSDTDGDGVFDNTDNCKNTPNANQKDTDGDGKGDICDQKSELDLSGAFASILPYVDIENPKYIWNDEWQIFVAHDSAVQAMPELWHGVIRGTPTEIDTFLTRAITATPQNDTGIGHIGIADLIGESEFILQPQLNAYNFAQTKTEDFMLERWTRKLLKNLRSQKMSDALGASPGTDAMLDEIMRTIDLSPDISLREQIRGDWPKATDITSAEFLSRLIDTLRETGRWNSANLETIITRIAKRDLKNRHKLRQLQFEIENQFYSQISQKLAQPIKILTKKDNKNHFLLGNRAVDITSVRECTNFLGDTDGQLVELNSSFNFSSYAPDTTSTAATDYGQCIFPRAPITTGEVISQNTLTDDDITKVRQNCDQNSAIRPVNDIRGTRLADSSQNPPQNFQTCKNINPNSQIFSTTGAWTIKNIPSTITRVEPNEKTLSAQFFTKSVSGTQIFSGREYTPGSSHFQPLRLPIDQNRSMTWQNITGKSKNLNFPNIFQTSSLSELTSKLNDTKKLIDTQISSGHTAATTKIQNIKNRDIGTMNLCPSGTLATTQNLNPFTSPSQNFIGTTLSTFVSDTSITPPTQNEKITVNGVDIAGTDIRITARSGSIIDFTNPRNLTVSSGTKILANSGTHTFSRAKILDDIGKTKITIFTGATFSFTIGTLTASALSSGTGHIYSTTDTRIFEIAPNDTVSIPAGEWRTDSPTHLTGDGISRTGFTGSTAFLTQNNPLAVADATVFILTGTVLLMPIISKSEYDTKQYYDENPVQNFDKLLRPGTHKNITGILHSTSGATIFAQSAGTLIPPKWRHPVRTPGEIDTIYKNARENLPIFIDKTLTISGTLALSGSKIIEIIDPQNIPSTKYQIIDGKIKLQPADQISAHGKVILSGVDRGARGDWIWQSDNMTITAAGDILLGIGSIFTQNNTTTPTIVIAGNAIFQNNTLTTNGIALTPKFTENTDEFIATIETLCGESKNIWDETIKIPNQENWIVDISFSDTEIDSILRWNMMDIDAKHAEILREMIRGDTPRDFAVGLIRVPGTAKKMLVNVTTGAQNRNSESTTFTPNFFADILQTAIDQNDQNFQITSEMIAEMRQILQKTHSGKIPLAQILTAIFDAKSATSALPQTTQKYLRDQIPTSVGRSATRRRSLATEIGTPIPQNGNPQSKQAVNDIFASIGGSVGFAIDFGDQSGRVDLPEWPSYALCELQAKENCDDPDARTAPANKNESLSTTPDSTDTDILDLLGTLPTTDDAAQIAIQNAQNNGETTIPTLTIDEIITLNNAKSSFTDTPDSTLSAENDTDQDGILDAEELKFFNFLAPIDGRTCHDLAVDPAALPLSQRCADNNSRGFLDNDGDGISDFEEINSDTSPIIPEARRFISEVILTSEKSSIPFSDTASFADAGKTTLTITLLDQNGEKMTESGTIVLLGNASENCDTIGRCGLTKNIFQTDQNGEITTIWRALKPGKHVLRARAAGINSAPLTLHTGYEIVPADLRENVSARYLALAGGAYGDLFATGYFAGKLLHAKNSKLLAVSALTDTTRNAEASNSLTSEEKITPPLFSHGENHAFLNIAGGTPVGESSFRFMAESEILFGDPTFSLPPMPIPPNRGYDHTVGQFIAAEESKILTTQFFRWDDDADKDMILMREDGVIVVYKFDSNLHEKFKREIEVAKLPGGLKSFEISDIFRENGLQKFDDVIVTTTEGTWRLKNLGELFRIEFLGKLDDSASLTTTGANSISKISAEKAFANAEKSVSADFDKDGKEDLLKLDNKLDLTLFYGDGSGDFNAQQNIGNVATSTTDDLGGTNKILANWDAMPKRNWAGNTQIINGESKIPTRNCKPNAGECDDKELAYFIDLIPRDPNASRTDDRLLLLHPSDSLPDFAVSSGKRSLVEKMRTIKNDDTTWQMNTRPLVNDTPVGFVKLGYFWDSEGINFDAYINKIQKTRTWLQNLLRAIKKVEMRDVPDFARQITQKIRSGRLISVERELLHFSSKLANTFGKNIHEKLENGEIPRAMESLTFDTGLVFYDSGNTLFSDPLTTVNNWNNPHYNASMDGKNITCQRQDEYVCQWSNHDKSNPRLTYLDEVRRISDESQQKFFTSSDLSKDAILAMEDGLEKSKNPAWDSSSRFENGRWHSWFRRLNAVVWPANMLPDFVDSREEITNSISQNDLFAETLGTATFVRPIPHQNVFKKLTKTEERTNKYFTEFEEIAAQHALVRKSDEYSQRIAREKSNFWSHANVLNNNANDLTNTSASETKKSLCTIYGDIVATTSAFASLGTDVSTAAQKLGEDAYNACGTTNEVCTTEDTTGGWEPGDIDPISTCTPNFTSCAKVATIKNTKLDKINTKAKSIAAQCVTSNKDTATISADIISKLAYAGRANTTIDEELTLIRDGEPTAHHCDTLGATPSKFKLVINDDYDATTTKVYTWCNFGKAPLNGVQFHDRFTDFSLRDARYTLATKEFNPNPSEDCNYQTHEGYKKAVFGQDNLVYPYTNIQDEDPSVYSPYGFKSACVRGLMFSPTRTKTLAKTFRDKLSSFIDYTLAPEFAQSGHAPNTAVTDFAGSDTGREKMFVSTNNSARIPAASFATIDSQKTKIETAQSEMQQFSKVNFRDWLPKSRQIQKCDAVSCDENLAGDFVNIDAAADESTDRYDNNWFEILAMEDGNTPTRKINPRAQKIPKIKTPEGATEAEKNAALEAAYAVIDDIQQLADLTPRKIRIVNEVHESITKTAQNLTRPDDKKLLPGDEILITITIDNKTPKNIKNLSIADYTPTNLEVIKSSFRVDGDILNLKKLNNIEYPFGVFNLDISAGDTVSVTYRAIVLAVDIPDISSDDITGDDTLDIIATLASDSREWRWESNPQVLFPTRGKYDFIAPETPKKIDLEKNRIDLFPNADLFQELIEDIDNEGGAVKVLSDYFENAGDFGTNAAANLDTDADGLSDRLEKILFGTFGQQNYETEGEATWQGIDLSLSPQKTTFFKKLITLSHDIFSPYTAHAATISGDTILHPCGGASETGVSDGYRCVDGVYAYETDEYGVYYIDPAQLWCYNATQQCETKNDTFTILTGAQEPRACTADETAVGKTSCTREVTQTCGQIKNECKIYLETGSTIGSDPYDIDGDGVPNDWDDDIDGDGIPNNLDNDIDGDGIANNDDGQPYGQHDPNKTAPEKYIDGVLDQLSCNGGCIALPQNLAFGAAVPIPIPFISPNFWPYVEILGSLTGKICAGLFMGVGLGLVGIVGVAGDIPGCDALNAQLSAGLDNLYKLKGAIIDKVNQISGGLITASGKSSTTKRGVAGGVTESYKFVKFRSDTGLVQQIKNAMKQNGVIAAFPKVIGDWFTKQWESLIRNVTTPPHLTVILPDFEVGNVQSNNNVVPASENGDALDGIIRAANTIPILNLEREVIEIKLPWLSPGEAIGILANLREIRDDTVNQLYTKYCIDSIKYNINGEQKIQNTKKPGAQMPSFCQDPIYDQAKAMITANVEPFLTSIDKNIAAIQSYMNYPAEIGKWIHFYQQYMNDILRLLDQIVTWSGGWVNKQITTYNVWIRTIAEIIAILESMRLIIDLFINYRSCSACAQQRYSLINVLFQIVGGSININLPDIIWPRWPDVRLDFTQITFGGSLPSLTLKIPVFKLKRDNFVFPKLQKFNLPALPHLIGVQLDFPRLPILPEPPQLPPWPQLPSIELPKLPNLPLPPKIPALSAEITGVLDLIGKIFEILCFVMGNNIVAIPPATLGVARFSRAAGQIDAMKCEVLTQRPLELQPIDLAFSIANFEFGEADVDISWVDLVDVSTKVDVNVNFDAMLSASLKEWVDVQVNAPLTRWKNKSQNTINDGFAHLNKQITDINSGARALEAQMQKTLDREVNTKIQSGAASLNKLTATANKNSDEITTITEDKSGFRSVEQTWSTASAAVTASWQKAADKWTTTWQNSVDTTSLDLLKNSCINSTPTVPNIAGLSVAPAPDTVDQNCIDDLDAKMKVCKDAGRTFVDCSKEVSQTNITNIKTNGTFQTFTDSRGNKCDPSDSINGLCPESILNNQTGSQAANIQLLQKYLSQATSSIDYETTKKIETEKAYAHLAKNYGIKALQKRANLALRDSPYKKMRDSLANYLGEIDGIENDINYILASNTGEIPSIPEWQIPAFNIIPRVSANTASPSPEIPINTTLAQLKKSIGIPVNGGWENLTRVKYKTAIIGDVSDIGIIYAWERTLYFHEKNPTQPTPNPQNWNGNFENITDLIPPLGTTTAKFTNRQNITLQNTKLENLTEIHAIASEAPGEMTTHTISRHGKLPGDTKIILAHNGDIMNPRTGSTQPGDRLYTHLGADLTLDFTANDTKFATLTAGEMVDITVPQILAARDIGSVQSATSVTRKGQKIIKITKPDQISVGDTLFIRDGKITIQNDGKTLTLLNDSEYKIQNNDKITRITGDTFAEVSPQIQIPKSRMTDRDADNVPDNIEFMHGLSPTHRFDGLLDFDRDGLKNYEEIALGTDIRLADTDGDGTNDGDEVSRGTDPKNKDIYARNVVKGTPIRQNDIFTIADNGRLTIKWQNGEKTTFTGPARIRIADFTQNIPLDIAADEFPRIKVQIITNDDYATQPARFATPAPALGTPKKPEPFIPVPLNLTFRGMIYKTGTIAAIPDASAWQHIGRVEWSINSGEFFAKTIHKNGDDAWLQFRPTEIGKNEIKTKIWAYPYDPTIEPQQFTFTFDAYAPNITILPSALVNQKIVASTAPNIPLQITRLRKNNQNQWQRQFIASGSTSATGELQIPFSVEDNSITVLREHEIRINSNTLRAGDLLTAEITNQNGKVLRSSPRIPFSSQN